MANYQFTFRNARGDSAGALSAPFADDELALSHARVLLARYAEIEVSRGATRLAHLTAPSDFGRRPRFTASSTSTPRKAPPSWLNWRGAR